MRDGLHLVVGLGQTGLSCVRYLVEKKIPVAVVDTRENPPCLAACQQQFPDVPISLGPFSEAIFSQATTLVVSPGVSLSIPEIKRCRQNNVPVIGDIELFARDARAPIIAITGSNGKSTLTTLVGQMINEAGLRAVVCGNIGIPVLDCLTQAVPDYYVVELSSFQLEITYSLKALVAVVLNISPDHLDRHADFDAYLAAKKRIYNRCETAILNADEPEIWSDLSFESTPIFFSLKDNEKDAWVIRDDALFHAKEKIIAVADLKLQEKHNCQNFLVALAIGKVIGLPIDSMRSTCSRFSGLPHRCQKLNTKDGIQWYNDSKATNVGAAVAAIKSVGAQTAGRCILIAGGDSKNAAMDELKQPVSQYVSYVIVLGKDANKIKSTLHDCAEVISVDTMTKAVCEAKRIAQRGDTVLLSPACASWDQYANYMARGEDFMRAVEA